MDLSAKPSEIGDLAKLLYGQGASQAPQNANPPDAAQAAPAGPVDANTQNPIPNNQGFYNLVTGQGPATPQEQVNAPPVAAPPAQQAPPTNAASTPVAVSTPQGQGSAVKLFTDPNALFLMGAALGSRSNNETFLQSASRGLLAGMEYMNAKDRQAVIDQTQQNKAALEAAESGQRVAESKTRVAGSEQEMRVKEGMIDINKQLAMSKLDELKQRISSAGTTQEREKLQIQYDKLRNDIYKTYGMSEAGIALAGKGAQVGGQILQNEKTGAENDLLRQKLETLKGLSPEDRSRVLLGGAARGLKTPEDRAYDFINKNAAKFTNPNTGEVDMDRALEAWRKTENVLSGKGADVSGVPQGAIDHLKKNPQLKAAFDKKYGVGAADAVLGGGKKQE